MEVSKITKIAKVLNIVEIVVTVVMFVLFRALNSAGSNVTTQAELDSLLGIQSVALFVLGAVSVVVIALTVFLMVKNAGRVKGLGCLLAAGIITLAFAITGIMFGIIIWVLSGLSLKSLKQKNAEEDFKAQLNLENSMENNDTVNAQESEAEKIYE